MNDQEKAQVQAEELAAIREMLHIRIDGDWDEDMIGTAFDSLETLLCGDVAEQAPQQRRSAPQRRRRRR